MKIEIIVALILGTALGLGGMFVVAQLVGPKPTSPHVLVTTPTASPTVTNEEVKTALTAPLPFTSWDTSPLVIEGTAKNGSFVVLVGDTQDTIIPLSTNIFKTTTSPLLGVHGYRFFTSFGDKFGDSVVVSYKDLEKSKKIMFGVVTDLTAESLQMRGSDGTIDQIAYAPNIVVATLIKDPKRITATDIAIGDRIVVSGDTAEKNVSLASGIFIIPSDFGVPAYTMKTGTMTSINKTDIVISTKDGDISLKTSGDTKYFGVKDNGTIRKRTKLIQTDVSRTTYVTYLNNSNIIRSIFISE